MWDLATHKERIERTLLPIWSLFIALIGILPLTNFVGHSHWEYIQWFPTADNFRSWGFLFDIAANIGIFIPLGYLLSQSYPTITTGRCILLAMTVAGLLSMSIELFQVYCHNRHPSPADLLSNTTGGFIGAFLSNVRHPHKTSLPKNPTTPTQPDRSLAP